MLSHIVDKTEIGGVNSYATKYTFVNVQTFKTFIEYIIIYLLILDNNIIINMYLNVLGIIIIYNLYFFNIQKSKSVSDFGYTL